MANPTTALLPRSIIAPAVGTSPVQVAPSNVGRITLWIYNPSLTITLAFSPPDIVPAINGAGSITLPPLTGVSLGGPNDYAFTNSVLAIASSGASNPITIWEW